MERLQKCLVENRLNETVISYVTCRIETAKRGDPKFTENRSKFAKNTFKKALNEIRKVTPHFGHPDWFKFVPYHK